MSGIDNVLSLDQSELQQMRYIVRTGYNVVFEYDSTTDDLREWLWSVPWMLFIIDSPLTRRRPVYNDGPRVPPSELRDYCQTHRLKGPRCFCARFAKAGDEGGEGFDEESYHRVSLRYMQHNMRMGRRTIASMMSSTLLFDTSRGASSASPSVGVMSEARTVGIVFISNSEVLSSTDVAVVNMAKAKRKDVGR